MSHVTATEDDLSEETMVPAVDVAAPNAASDAGTVPVDAVSTLEATAVEPFHAPAVGTALSAAQLAKATGEDNEPLPADRFLNRELSWLDFNERVLALAEDARCSRCWSG